MSKYIFKPYSAIFPELFQYEKARIMSHVNISLVIEHVGSTAIPGLGGKGIIDVSIAVKKELMETVCKEIQSLGYDFREDHSTSDRLFLKSDLKEEGVNRYHIHLTHPESKDWKDFIFFRDHLRNNPKIAEEYGALKKTASLASEGEGSRYRELKDPLFKKVLTT